MFGEALHRKVSAARRASRAAQTKRSAETDVRKASESLERVIEKGENSRVDSNGQVDQKTLETIEEATKRLEQLKHRIEEHAALVVLVAEKETALQQKRDKYQCKLDEIDAGIVEASMARVNILSERDTIARDLLRRKREVKVC